jgi:carbon storage regulator
MLVLSRRENESVIIDNDIELKLLKTQYNLAIFEVKYSDQLKEFESSTDGCFNISKNIKVSIVEIQKGKARIGIDAPKEISIHREEIYNKIKDQKSRQFTAS